MGKPRLRIKKMTRDERMAKFAEEWQREFGHEVIDPDAVAEWMVATHRFDKDPPSPTQLCRKELQRALRNSTYVDPQGREVRIKHPVRGETGMLWHDIRTAKPAVMRASLQVRRQGIFADVKQCKRDVDSYNDNNQFSAQIEMDYNFDLDIEESTKPTEYPDEKPEE